MLTPDHFNRLAQGKLPGFLGMIVTRVAPGELAIDLPIRPELIAPNGYLHAGTLVALADTAAGFGCLAHLPEGATSFTTVELKTNFLGTATDGTLEAVARPVHRGKTTQVWDTVVTHRDSGRTLALFRCTQFVLYAAGR
ncbi:MAG TPA: PaaI family thioesterase [Gemmatales bacterium]|nr:PaaI family thioesterase [Gemmatales bacterium]